MSYEQYQQTSDAVILWFKVVRIVAPLPFISGIATAVFLFVRSELSRRITIIILLLCLFAMVFLVATGIPLSTVVDDRGGPELRDFGIAITILFYVVLPALAGMICLLALLSVWHSKRTIPNRS